jgi:hypothetical protein
MPLWRDQKVTAIDLIQPKEARGAPLHGEIPAVGICGERYASRQHRPDHCSAYCVLHLDFLAEASLPHLNGLFAVRL